MLRLLTFVMLHHFKMGTGGAFLCVIKRLGLFSIVNAENLFLNIILKNYAELY